MPLPNDPIILLSYVNTKLRDFYPSIEEMGKALDLDIDELKLKLKAAGYEYDPDLNRFV